MAPSGRITLNDLQARVNALDQSNIMTVKQDAKTALHDFLTYLDQLDQRITILESEANHGK